MQERSNLLVKIQKYSKLISYNLLKAFYKIEILRPVKVKEPAANI